MLTRDDARFEIFGHLRADDLEAAYYLREIGEMDLTFDLLLSFVEWLVPRGRILDRLAALEFLQGPQSLNPQKQARFFTLRGQVYADLGDLSQGRTDFQQAIEVGQRLAQQDPANTEWQRDLSVSHDRIGDVQRAQGDLAAALRAYEQGLRIAEALARRAT